MKNDLANPMAGQAPAWATTIAGLALDLIEAERQVDEARRLERYKAAAERIANDITTLLKPLLPDSPIFTWVDVEGEDVIVWAGFTWGLRSYQVGTSAQRTCIALVWDAFRAELFTTPNGLAKAIYEVLNDPQNNYGYPREKAPLCNDWMVLLKNETGPAD